MKYRITKEKFLTADELKSVARVLKDAQYNRYALVFGLLMFTGARVQEILNLEYDKIPLDGHMVPIKGLKGSFDRDIHVPHELSILISSEIHARQFCATFDKTASKLLIQISYRRLVQVWEQIRPVEKPLKAFRHAFAIHLYKQTRDVFFVKNALGHSCLSNTLVYVDYLTRDQSLKKLAKMDLYGVEE